MRQNNTRVYLLLLLCWGMMVHSCNIINPKENIPTYFHIDSFRTQNNFSHKITAVWVYYNNGTVGVFDLPATFPVMAAGEGILGLAPGIAVDGQNSQVTPYPFYTLDTTMFTAQPGTIITKVPETRYYSLVKQTTISDFEGGITNFGKWSGNANVVPVSADSLRFDGGFSGAIYLNAVGDSSVDSSITTFSIPTGTTAFIEINYKSTVPFYLGLQAKELSLTTPPYFLAGVNPSAGWQKFYLNAQAFATRYPASTYHFYIKAVLAPGQTSGRLLIDNIKLVTF
ncbi:MAG: hypothetical protein V4649_06200 [Bacteroidota bacterium]